MVPSLARRKRSITWWGGTLILLLLLVCFLLTFSNAQDETCSVANGTCRKENDKGVVDENDSGPQQQQQQHDELHDDDGEEDFEDEYEDDDCFNEADDEACDFWASNGECENNPGFMLEECRQSCEVCEDDDDNDDDDYGEDDDDDDDKEYDEYGIVQNLHENEPFHAEKIRTLLEEMRAYMHDLHNDPDTPEDVRELLDSCQNKESDCAYLATQGTCDENPGYMKLNCAPVCKSCDQLSLSRRCPLDPSEPRAWGPGDNHRFFENITSSTFEGRFGYTTTILSRPEYAPGDNEENAEYDIGPWVVILDDFLSKDEALRMIALGALEGYERSMDVAGEQPDGTFAGGTNNRRTSTNAWCTHTCYEDPVAKRIMNRIANLTSTDEKNSEYLQLLQYKVGQKYDVHHDFIPHQVERQTGPRLLTVFIYLNDVEGGGETHFPDLDITVIPKQGRALVWSSVLNDDPDLIDVRTEHQALPVERGIKFGVNAWIHQRDFKTANLNACL